MNVKNLIPNPRIAAHVDRILVVEHYQMVSPFSLPLFANGVPTILFKSTNGTLGNSTTTHLTLFGQTIFPEAIRFTEGFTLIAYFFKPWSLYSLFGVTGQELTDKPIDLNLLAPKKTITLQEQLLNAGTTEIMIGLLDDYIFHLISHAANDSPIITYAATQMAVHASKEILVKVQKDLHLTERTFQRIFEKNIGVAPNLYRRICQFNAGFQQLNSRKFHKLSNIAFENGYADQSHYIRAFREFTNLTPKDYLNFGSEA
ncbi:MAG: helix-turn-helix domain-containing protein [Bacteroidota bacterium]